MSASTVMCSRVNRFTMQSETGEETMTMRRTTTLLSAVLILLIFAVSVLAQSAGLLDAIVQHDRLSRLADVIRASDVRDTLNGNGAYTLFAPTNGAIEAELTALNFTVDALLANPELLNQIVRHHTVEGRYTAHDLRSQADEHGSLRLTTLGGSVVDVFIQGDAIYLAAGPLAAEAGVLIAEADINAANSVVHILDSALHPFDTLTQ
jgi:uncharacterized surface protein with fasciclin (FAS1) repeats